MWGEVCASPGSAPCRQGRAHTPASETRGSCPSYVAHGRVLPLRKGGARLATVKVLVLNAGSSSLKASVLEPSRTEPLTRAEIGWGADATAAPDRDRAVERLLAELAGKGAAGASIEAVGHRVVHGGATFTGPVRIEPSTVAAIEALRALAPLHNGIAAETIAAAQRALPGVPHVAAFDTAFHATLSPAACVYPLPYAWHVSFGVRRFGFHGLSVAWSVERAGALLDRRPESLDLVVAHLGSGCSVTATLGGRSVDTSMGMTPLEGLMMGTRAGSVDPGILVTLLRDRRLSVEALADALEHGSGLLGISGATADMRRLLERERDGDERSALAIEMFVRRAAAGIAASATALPRLDAIVFTGGIGEHAGELRARIAARLAALGVDPPSARDVTADAVLGGGKVALLRVEAREDIVIARQVQTVLA